MVGWRHRHAPQNVLLDGAHQGVPFLLPFLGVQEAQEGTFGGWVV